MLQSLKRFHNVKTFKEFWELLTWQDIGAIAAFPMLLFLISPLIYFLHVTLNDGWRYNMTLETIRMVTAILSVPVLVCGFFKCRSQGCSVRGIAADFRPWLWFLALDALILLSDVVNNGISGYARIGMPFRFESCFSFLSYGVCFYACAAMIRSEKVKIFLFRAFLIASVLICIIALLDYYNVIYIWHFHYLQDYGWGKTLTADFFQYNHYGYYLMLAVMLSLGMFLYESNVFMRWFSLASLVLHTVTLAINGTRGCFLACAAALVLMLVILHKVDRSRFKMLWIGLAVLAGASVIGCLLMPSVLDRMRWLIVDVYRIVTGLELPENAGSQRGLLWRLTLGYIAQKPLLGWGTEGIAEILNMDSEGVNSRPHCEYLQYAAFYGIPAACVYLAALISIFRKAYRQLTELRPTTLIALFAAFAYLVSACFGNTMGYTAPFLFIMLGLGFQTSLPEKNDKT